MQEPRTHAQRAVPSPESRSGSGPQAGPRLQQLTQCTERNPETNLLSNGR